MSNDPPEHTEPSCGLSRSLLGTGKGGGVGWKAQTLQSWCIAHPVRVLPNPMAHDSFYQSASPATQNMVHPVRVLPSPTAHGLLPRQSAPQSHDTWLTMSECSPVPQHMAHPIRLLPSPPAHGSPRQSAPQSHSSAC